MPDIGVQPPEEIFEFFITPSWLKIRKEALDRHCKKLALYILLAKTASKVSSGW
jgi:hypothetical protein